MGRDIARSHAARGILGLAALTFAAAALAQAPQVYRYVDPGGRVVYSDRPPPPDVKNVQTKRLGSNYVETSEPSVAAQVAADRFPATLFTFDCGDVCQNAEALLNRRGVPYALVDVQKDEQGMIRMKAMTGEERVPVLALGDKLIVKGYSEGRWQAALDEAGYPKTPPPRRTATGSRSEPTPTPTPVVGDRAVTPLHKGGDYPK
ncbi:MAG: glutaredoxin family protein [Burkholderiales bacterium]|nr:glutaredoxin family protein [Burkholderiales bacterium]